MMIKYFWQIADDGHKRIAECEWDDEEVEEEFFYYRIPFSHNDEIDMNFLPDGYENWKVYDSFFKGCPVTIKSPMGD